MCVEIRLKVCLRANPITDLMSKLNQYLRTIRLSGQVTETLEAVVFGFVCGGAQGFSFCFWSSQLVTILTQLSTIAKI